MQGAKAGLAETSQDCLPPEAWQASGGSILSTVRRREREGKLIARTN